MENHIKARLNLSHWQESLAQNIYLKDKDIQHALQFYLPDEFHAIHQELSQYGKICATLFPTVAENNNRLNWPRLNAYNGMGQRVDEIIHHPTYHHIGNVIYQSKLMQYLALQGGLLKALSFFFVSSHLGEAGHHCPIACSAGIVRVLQKFPDTYRQAFYLEKLLAPSFDDNYTGAQFLTEVQGGSDVGQNATLAKLNHQGQWQISGEKWFCSNANADLILMTARFDESISGTKGLGLFLVPTLLENGEHNYFQIRRLKEKIGTNSMASGEIDFINAIAYPIGKPEDGFKIVMENVLHISRLFNSFSVIALARSAINIATEYAKNRIAFGQAIIQYPLVFEKLAHCKVENTALLSAIMSTTKRQDEFDKSDNSSEETKLLLRLLANLNKYYSALKSFHHVHHALDTLAGNGAIENFSAIPRLLRDSIVTENWEGTHNTIYMQILRDIHRYAIDEIFLKYYPNEKLQKMIRELKQASEPVQSLLIKSVVNQMAIVLCEQSLETEAENNQSKSRQLLLFKQINKNKINIDQDYLDLLKNIVVEC